jgi:hypothetical protein
MRHLSLLLALSLVPQLAWAKRNHKRADSSVTYVDDEPISQAAAEKPRARLDGDPAAPSGTRMDASMRAPQLTQVASGETTARGPSSTPARSRSDEEVSASAGAFDELVAKQVRRNSAGIEACEKEAVKRSPAASGTVTLSVVVEAKKIKSVHVSADTVHDIDLDACLVKAGLNWKLQLTNARFNYPVVISPSASR